MANRKPLVIVSGEYQSIQLADTLVNASGVLYATQDDLDALSFLSLSDTPASYSGQAGRFVKVNMTATGLEFVAGGGGSSELSSITAAVAANTINNGDNAQAWNWSLSTVVNNAFQFGENVPSITAGFQTITFLLPITGSNPTGLVNDPTTYTATVSVDGGGPQPISIAGDDAQTFSTLITQLQSQTIGATWGIINGDLRLTSDLIGPGSSISISDTDLFSSLTNFQGIVLSNFPFDSGFQNLVSITNLIGSSANLLVIKREYDQTPLISITAGGRIEIQAGDDGQGDISGSNNGTSVFIRGGNSILNDNVGGNVFISAGQGGRGISNTFNNAGGSIQLSGGHGTNGGAGGNVAITGGEAGAGDATGGDINILAGFGGVTAGAGGNTNISGGLPNSIGSGGNVVLTGGERVGNGFQVVDVGGFHIDSTPTGLLNDATVYTASIDIDGGGPQPILITGSTAQTYADLIIQLGASTTGGTWFLDGTGNLRALSFSSGAISTVVISDTDLFSSLTDFVAINFPMDGSLSYTNGSIICSTKNSVVLTSSDSNATSKQYILRTHTSDVVPEEMFIDGTGGILRMVLGVDTTWKFEVHVVARRTDVDNTSAGYQYAGVIDNNGTGTTALVGTIQQIMTPQEDDPTYTVSITADNVNDALIITVTGNTGHEVDWVAFVRTVEVIG